MGGRGLLHGFLVGVLLCAVANAASDPWFNRGLKDKPSTEPTPTPVPCDASKTCVITPPCITAEQLPDSTCKCSYKFTQNCKAGDTISNIMFNFGSSGKIQKTGDTTVTEFTAGQCVHFDVVAPGATFSVTGVDCDVTVSVMLHDGSAFKDIGQQNHDPGFTCAATGVADKCQFCTTSVQFPDPRPSKEKTHCEADGVVNDGGCNIGGECKGGKCVQAYKDAGKDCTTDGVKTQTSDPGSCYNGGECGTPPTTGTSKCNQKYMAPDTPCTTDGVKETGKDATTGAPTDCYNGGLCKADAGTTTPTTCKQQYLPALTPCGVNNKCNKGACPGGSTAGSEKCTQTANTGTACSSADGFKDIHEASSDKPCYDGGKCGKANSDGISSCEQQYKPVDTECGINNQCQSHKCLDPSAASGDCHETIEKLGTTCTVYPDTDCNTIFNKGYSEELKKCVKCGCDGHGSCNTPTCTCGI